VGVVQTKMGASGTSSLAVTFDGAITEGNTIVTAVYAINTDAGYDMSGSGWTHHIDQQPWALVFVSTKVAGSSESTTVTYTAVDTDPIVMMIAEVEGYYEWDGYDLTAVVAGGEDTHTYDYDTHTPVAADSIAFALMCVDEVDENVTGSMSWDESFTAIGTARLGGNFTACLGAAYKELTGTTAVSGLTATLTYDGTAANNRKFGVLFTLEPSAPSFDPENLTAIPDGADVDLAWDAASGSPTDYTGFVEDQSARTPGEVFVVGVDTPEFTGEATTARLISSLASGFYDTQVFARYAGQAAGTISPRAAGTWAAVNATTQTVTIPGSPAAGDMMLCLVAVKPYTASPTMNNSWTAVGTKFANGTTANGNGSGSVTVMAFYKEHTGSETNPTVTWGTTSAPGAAVIVIFQKSSGAWATPVGDGGGDTSAGTGHSATIQSHVSVTAGDMVVAHTGICDDTTMTVPTFTQASVTYDTVAEYPTGALSSTTSNDISADACYRLATAGTSSAAAVVTGTLSSSETGSSWMTRLRTVAIPDTYSSGSEVVGFEIGSAAVEMDVTLATTATISPVARVTRPAAATLALTTTVAPVARVTRPASTTVLVTATITPAARVTRPASAAVALTVDVTADAELERGASVTVPLTVSITADAEVIRGAASTIPITATIAPTAAVTRPIDTTVPVTVTVTAQAGLDRGADVTVPVTVDIEAAAELVRGANATVPLTVDVAADAELERGASATIPLTLTVEADAEREAGASATVPLAVTIAASASVTRNAAVDVPLAVTVAPTAARMRFGDVTVPVTVTIAPTGHLERGAAATIASSFAVEAEAAATRPVDATVPLTVDVAADAEREAGATVSAPITVTIEADAEVVHPAGSADVDVPLVVTVTPVASVEAQAAATLALTVGIASSASVDRPASATIATTVDVDAEAQREAGASASIPIAFGVEADAEVIAPTADAEVAVPLTFGVTASAAVVRSATASIPITVVFTTTATRAAGADVTVPFVFTVTGTAVGAYYDLDLDGFPVPSVWSAEAVDGWEAVGVPLRRQAILVGAEWAGTASDGWSGTSEGLA
jgi:hypothetical protein